jgi:hypothetical protein
MMSRDGCKSAYRCSERGDAAAEGRALPRGLRGPPPVSAAAMQKVMYPEPSWQMGPCIPRAGKIRESGRG